jgi:diguanylate cyclase (GGDEF)-like protein
MEIKRIIRETWDSKFRMQRLRYFFLVLTTLLIVQIIISLWPFYNAVTSQRNMLKFAEQQLVDTIRQHIEDQLSAVSSDIDNLTEIYISLGKYAPSRAARKSFLEKEFLYLLKNRLYYDQIRIIDNRGMEILRTNYNYGLPYIVPARKYQDKARRYYVIEGLKLAADGLYISPFDLNVENEKIEQPIKPTIRFVAPVFHSHKMREGILVVNYLGSRLLEQSVKLAATNRFIVSGNDSRLLMVNADGYFFIGPTPGYEWGFMYPELKNRRFQQLFYGAWNVIEKNISGAFYTDRGFLTFTTVGPLKKLGPRKVNAGGNFWKIILFVSNDQLSAMAKDIQRRYLTLNILFSLFSLVIAFAMTLLNTVRKNAEHQLLHMASTDPLTAVLNRRSFLDRFEYERIRSSRYNEQISVIMGDIDHFKMINDTSGHDAGDSLLCALAEILKHNLREQDSICRWGGEEFIVLMPMTGLDRAIDTAEKLRRVIETHKFAYKDVRMSITMSFGVALYSPDISINECIRRADRYMYASKSAGRNRVSYDMKGRNNN